MSKSSNTSKRSKSPKILHASKESGIKIGRDSETARFLAAAEKMKVANTSSREVARTKLKEMGILDEDGQLSKNYK